MALKNGAVSITKYRPDPRTDLSRGQLPRSEPAKARNNDAAVGPITHASGYQDGRGRLQGRAQRPAAWRAHDRALASLRASPGARADPPGNAPAVVRTPHNPALWQLANRLVGSLHGCLKTRTPGDEATAWRIASTRLGA
jgi:hypothetical protein